MIPPNNISSEMLWRLMHAPRDVFSRVEQLLAGVPLLADAAPAPSRAFTRCGDFWTVRFDGDEVHLPDTLGARYLDFLLHRPNKPISAFDLEVAVTPEKGKARTADSPNAAANGDTIRQYLRELNRLRAERSEAEDAGNHAAVAQIDEDIESIERELRRQHSASDSGERARNNVRKAIAAVLRGLETGDAAQRRFAEHISQFVDTGFTCIYHQSPGKEWA